MLATAPRWRVRDARPADAAWLVAGNTAMARETEALTLDPTRAAAGVAAVLADPARGFYLVAEDPATAAPVGQLMVTYEWSDWRAATFWWIQSVHVLPEARRQGVYRALYADLLARARARDDVAGLRLYVHHDNARAQATYGALGMDAAAYRLYEVDFVIARP